MPQSKSIPVLSLLLLVLTAMAMASPLVSREGQLQFSAVKKGYADGEFDLLRKDLETFLKNHSRTAPRDELVMAYKYLGVIHASRDAKGPAAEAYLGRLLDLAPNVELTDLYVSRGVEDLFQRLKRERFIKSKHDSLYDELGNPIRDAKTAHAPDSLRRITTIPLPDSKSAHAAKPDKRNKPDKPRLWPWLALGGLTAAGITTYLVLQDGEETKKNPLAGGQ